MENLKEKSNKAFDALKAERGYKNRMQAPRVLKVVVSSGVGSFKDKNKFKVVEDRLARITGQKAAPRGAKISIATFKSRQGDVVGYQVTLRGKRMYDFLDRLVHLALPRTKDFRGISLGAADEMGNYTLGIKEHNIFPETSDEELRDVFGMSVTIVTTTKSKEEAQAFLTYLGFPFKK
ncbi:MAG: 50S ribosomal protein L5 [Parcubacteria group bacterium]